MNVSRRRTLLGVGGLYLGVRPAQAEGPYPTRPVKIIVPFPAGGSVDPPIRVVADTLSFLSGQRILVENRPGAGGNVGADFVAKSPPDGYTLLAASNSMTISQAIYPKLPWNVARDFTWIANFGTGPSIVLVNAAKVAARTLPELVALASARSPELNYGSPGSGTVSHLSAEALKRHVGLKMRHVPYRGSAPAVNDLLGGQVDVVVTAIGTAIPLRESPEVRAIAVTGASRAPHFPDVPTVAEMRPGYVFDGWLGLAGPAGMPPHIATRITGWVRAAVGDQAIVKKLVDIGLNPVFVDHHGVSRMVREELSTYGAIAKRAGVTIE